MLNNTATEAKYNVSIPISSGIGVKGDINGHPCHAETMLRMEIVGVGPSSSIDIEGKIRNSPNWYVITTATGAVTGTVDISTYDFVRYNVTTSDGFGTLYASGFIFNTSPGGGDASAANQVITNNRISPTLISGVQYDDIQVTFPSTVIEVYAYYLLTILQATVEITYTNTTKNLTLRARRI